MRAVLQAQINKTDRNDARGIAQMMRVGLYRAVHVKTLRSQKLRMRAAQTACGAEIVSQSTPEKETGLQFLSSSEYAVRPITR